MSKLRYPGSRTARDLSADLWRHSLEAYVSEDPALGSRYFDDFLVPSTNTTDATSVDGWFIEDMAAGGTVESFASIAAVNGKRTLSATTGTAHFGIEAHRGVARANEGTILAGNGQRIVHEVLLSLPSADAYFVGLSESGALLFDATTGLVATQDYIGFFRSAGGDLTFVTATDNAGGTAVADSVVVLAAASAPTGVSKLGFAINGDGTVDICVDGVLYPVAAKAINSLALPIEIITQKFMVGRGGGASATVSLPLDWVATFQQYELPAA